MAISVTHQFVSGIADSGDTTVVQPSDWNATHTIQMGTGKLLGRGTAGTGDVEEITLGTNLSLSGTTLNATGGGGMTYPGAGIAVSTGSAWDTSITPGTGVTTALAVNVGSAGAFITNGGALGTPSSGTLTNATGLPITAGTTGTLGPTRGGTGLATYTTGDLLYASAANTLSALAAGTDGYVLTMASGVPSWAAASGGGGSPGGSSGQIQYNNASAFGGSYLWQGTNTIEQYNSTNAQSYYLYNTRTDGSNYERGFVRWTSNAYEIGAEAAGTGSAREVILRTGPWYNIHFDTNGVLTGYFTTSAKCSINIINDNLLLIPTSGNWVQIYQASSAPKMRFTAATNTQLTCVVAAGDKEVVGAYTGAGHHLSVYAGKGSTQGTGAAGGNLLLTGGEAAGTGDNNGGNVVLSGGAPTGAGVRGYIILDNLPTSASGLPTGALWNNGGVLTIA